MSNTPWCVSPSQKALNHAVRWFRAQASGLANKYDGEQRRCGTRLTHHRRRPLLTPAQFDALSRCASSCAAAARALEGYKAEDIMVERPPAPWGSMLIARMDDGKLLYTARAWQNLGITPSAEAALRAAWHARWTFLYG